ncbi:hypothetical protein RRG08_044903 [Elysia crispata]|uniref:Uncharacterized protein n=1 Tax=Elysia crispata TaxID=231223 RepID=A0AAE0ZEM9_9GAST|nr:hypothetical protein RRG08_044903 [Elysia crispata]
MSKKQTLVCVVKHLKLKNRGLRESMAEAMGTFILVVFITGSSMQLVLSRQTTPLQAYIGGSIGVMLAFYMCGGVSGGCFNPAVSLAVCLTGRRPWTMFPWHVVGQMLGAFVAATVVYSVYTDALDRYDGGNRVLLGVNGTAGIFTSFPQEYLSTSQAFGDSALATGLLIVCALSVVDKRNMNAPAWFYPICIGLTVLAIVCGFGLNAGATINPAKDLAPRLFILIAGWGKEAFSFRGYNWFWIPVVAPLVGTVLATFIYWLFIEHHWPEEESVGVTSDTKELRFAEKCEPSAIELTSVTPEVGIINSSFVTEK